VYEDASTITSPWEHPSSVSSVGIFSEFKSVDPISTPRASHNSLAFKGLIECDSHISTSIPSFDLLPACAFIRVRVAEYALRRPFPWIISPNLFLLWWSVTSSKTASMFSETRRNLCFVVSGYRLNGRFYSHLRNISWNYSHNLSPQIVVHRAGRGISI